MIDIITLLLVCYLIGSIPFGIIVARLGYGVDIRKVGSGNPGGTNTFRTLGKKAGFIVTVADILKGTFAASLPFLLGIDVDPIVAGTFAVLGHCYPVFSRFRGGKAVATTGGLLLFAGPLLFLTALVTFFIVLKLTKYVSLSSIILGTAVHIYALLTQEISVMLATFFLFVLIAYRHKQNIKRMLESTEPKVKWI